MKDLTCKICNQILPSQRGLSSHIRHIHKLKYKSYYDTYLKTKNEGICLICNKPTKWKPGHGYLLYCGLDCSKRSPFKEQHKKETNLRKYGVTNSALLPEFKERNSQTVKFITKQIPKEEFIKRLEKRKTTNIQRFGYSSAMQNEKYFNKCMKTQYSRKVYILPSGKAIYLQGYEPQFLDFVFTNNLLTENDINYSPEKIRYIGFNNEDHYYFPDFDIPKLNLIVEIKSDYTEKRDKNIELKKRACLDSNKNYLRIVNNDFTEACQLLSSYSPFSIG